MTVTPQFQITGTTRVYGMIADPISHVRAPMVFNPVFEERGLDAVMVPLHLTPKSGTCHPGAGQCAEFRRCLRFDPPQDGTCRHL